MNKFRLKQKVKILSSKKIDGRYNYGTIIGVELQPDSYYLGYVNEREYLRRFTRAQYKVAYIDCYTNRAEVQSYQEKELDKK